MYINGILTVPAFNPTGNPGEYTIVGATFNNQADTAGQGAFAIQVGFALYVQASDVNTAAQIPGRVHRYKVTAVTATSPSLADMTVLWDEGGAEQDTPTNGLDAILSSVSTNLKYGYGTGTDLYPTLGAGMQSGMLNSEAQVTIDSLAKASEVVGSVNGKVAAVTITAGANVAIDNSGASIVVTSTGADEGTYQ